MNCKNCEGYDTAFGCGLFKCNNILSKRLATYEDAEEQGLLVRLPCKIGDTLYRPFFNSKCVLDYKIVEIMLRNTETLFVACHYEYNMKKYEELVYIWQIGKKYFLTHEAAEAALKGGTKDV